MISVVLSQSPLGFSITSPFKAVGRGIATGAKGVYHVVQDPRAQRLATTAAEQYAPNKYAAAQAQARSITQALHPYNQVMLAPNGQPVAMMPMDDDSGPAGPVQNNHILLIGAAVGVGLLALLLLRK